MITTVERYVSLVYDKIKEEITGSSVVHADETPVMVTKDGSEGMHKNYMWVYRIGSVCKAEQVILYDYQRTCKADALGEFLRGLGADTGYLSYGQSVLKLMDTVHGAKASAILYSIVETAKANELNIYNTLSFYRGSEAHG